MNVPEATIRLWPPKTYIGHFGVGLDREKRDRVKLPAMPSFDVVSKVDLMELDNAINIARKELGTRYDFRGTNTDLERTPEGIVLRSSDEPHAVAALTVLRERM